MIIAWFQSNFLLYCMPLNLVTYLTYRNYVKLRTVHFFVDEIQCICPVYAGNEREKRFASETEHVFSLFWKFYDEVYANDLLLSQVTLSKLSKRTGYSTTPSPYIGHWTKNAWIKVTTFTGKSTSLKGGFVCTFLEVDFDGPISTVVKPGNTVTT